MGYKKTVRVKNVDNIFVSIIMPVYNAVNYVEAAIKSIVEQSYTNFELILVDDGSSDGSEIICKEHANHYANITYIRQENKGICGARNVGIKIAKGVYVGFADHDDLYDRNYLKYMYEKIIRGNEPDAIRCGVSFVEELPNGKIVERFERMPEDVWTAEKLAEQLVYLPSSHFTVWNCLYKRQFLLDNNLSFPEVMKYGQEDYYFNLMVMQYLSKEHFIDEVLYTHFRRVGQSTSASFYFETIDCMAMNFKKEVQFLDKYLAENEKKEAYKWVAFARKITGILFYCFRSQVNAGLISIDCMISFSERIKPEYCKWQLNKRILKEIYKISRKYFCIVIAIYYGKWKLLSNVYKYII